MNQASNAVPDFLAEVRKKLSRGGPQAFWDCESGFQSLIDRKAVNDLMAQELERLAKNPLHSGQWQPNEWVLHRGGGTTLSVSYLDRELRYIHALPFYAMYAPIGPEPLSCERYRLPEGFNNDVFNPNLKLLRDGATNTNPGQILCMNTDQYAYDFRIRKPVLVLKFLTTAVRMLEWLFHRDSLTPWQANDADLTFTQLRVSADVLGKFAHQSSEAPLKRMTQHPYHAVRWSAIQNLGRLNRSTALSMLETALKDPHPHIRTAAQKTLARMKPKAGG